jgi:hypothetical protein
MILMRIDLIPLIDGIEVDFGAMGPTTQKAWKLKDNKAMF